VANAYVPSYVLTAGTAVYMLLRFRVDGAELDQLHFDEPPAGALPPVEELVATASESTSATPVPSVQPEEVS
jgi:hypothetical protein